MYTVLHLLAVLAIYRVGQKNCTRLSLQ